MQLVSVMHNAPLKEQEVAYNWSSIYVFASICPGAGEIHVSSGPEPSDGPQGSADSYQIPAHSCQGSVPKESTITPQGM